MNLKISQNKGGQNKGGVSLKSCILNSLSLGLLHFDRQGACFLRCRFCGFIVEDDISYMLFMYDVSYVEVIILDSEVLESFCHKMVLNSIKCLCINRDKRLTFSFHSANVIHCID